MREYAAGKARPRLEPGIRRQGLDCGARSIHWGSAWSTSDAAPRPPWADGSARGARSVERGPRGLRAQTLWRVVLPLATPSSRPASRASPTARQGAGETRERARAPARCSAPALLCPGWLPTRMAANRARRVSVRAPPTRTHTLCLADPKVLLSISLLLCLCVSVRERACILRSRGGGGREASTERPAQHRLLDLEHLCEGVSE